MSRDGADGYSLEQLMQQEYELHSGIELYLYSGVPLADISLQIGTQEQCIDLYLPLSRATLQRFRFEEPAAEAQNHLIAGFQRGGEGQLLFPGNDLLRLVHLHFDSRLLAELELTGAIQLPFLNALLKQPQVLFEQLMIISPPLQACLDQLLLSSATEHTDDDQLRAYSSELLFLLAGMLEGSDRRGGARGWTQGMSEAERLVRVREILYNEFSQPPDNRDLADRFGLRISRLVQGFEEQFGDSISDYIIARRMQVAKSLLDSDQYHVNDAAWSVGYKSVNLFVATFLNYYGIDPRSYETRPRGHSRGHYNGR